MVDDTERALEKQVRGIAFYLTTFAALADGIDDGERAFIRSYIASLVGQSAIGIALKAPEAEHAGILEAWQERAAGILGDIELDITARIEESSSEVGKSLAAAQLKMTCYELFRGFARSERVLLLSLLDSMAGRERRPEEVAFRAELRALVDEPEPSSAAEDQPQAGMTVTGMVESVPGRALVVEVRRQSRRAVVGCAGELNAATATQLEAAIEPLLGDPEGPLQIVINLHGVSSIATAAFRSLMIVAQRASEVGAVVRLSNPQPAVLRVLQLTGLASLMNSVRLPAAPAAAVTGTAAKEVGLAARIEALRLHFPSPTSSPRDDAYVTWSLLRGLNAIDAMKKVDRAHLGRRLPLDLEHARSFRLPEEPAALEDVIVELAGYLEGHMIVGHPLFQLNVTPPPTIASLAGHLFAALHNPNTIWDVACHRLAEAEIEAVSAVAELVGYDPAAAGGVFTYGGSGTVLYALKMGLEKALPGAMQRGVREPVKVVVSDAAHYAAYTSMGWLGLGTDNLVKVPTDEDNAMRPADLEVALRRILDAGERLGAIVATTGTTDAFGIDDVEHVVRLRDDLAREYALDYKPHVHADAVIGWAFSVFNGYDFAGNPLAFDPRTLRSLWDTRESIQHLGLADSLGIDFHKTGYTPYNSSAFLCRRLTDLRWLSRSPEAMPYLFQYGSYRPGEFTLETSRSGCSILAALGNLKALGRRGLQVLLGHAVAMAERLRSQIEASSFMTILNDYNHGPVTLFRVYPPGVSAEQSYRAEVGDPSRRADLLRHNAYNRRILQKILARVDEVGGVYLSQTERYRLTAYGEPIVALKSYVLTPFATEAVMDSVVQRIFEAVHGPE